MSFPADDCGQWGVLVTGHAVLEVDLGAVVANWQLLQAHHPSGATAAVIKADAYGLGARQVAAALYAAGCRHFFVAYLPEALVLREIVPDAMLAVLCGLLPGTEPDYMTHNLTPVLGSLGEIDRCSELARSLGRQIDVILHVDTGMARLGLDEGELATLASDHTRLDGLNLRYVMTHLVAAEVPGDIVNQLQRERFAAARRRLPAALASLANSSGIFLGAGFGSDLARPGAALCGINPTPGRPNPMRGTVRLMVRVLAVRDVPYGAAVGYNGTWIAARPSRIATAALGYADGFHRSLSGRGSAFFDDRPLPLVGRVSMDLTTFDVTDQPAVQPGSWLEVLGPHLSPDDVAAAAGTNGYEILTSLGRRFHRVYRTA
jgi:alanine racemase